MIYEKEMLQIGEARRRRRNIILTFDRENKGIYDNIFFVIVWLKNTLLFLCSKL